MKFWIVDAFTDKAFLGNPAAVFIVEEFPDIDLMQNIAAELNLSNIAFVQRISDRNYHIRWFTPNSEAPLCGHATVAATHVLIHSGLEQQNSTIIFQSISGELQSQYNNTLISLNFPRYMPSAVEFNEELAAIVNFKPIYTGFAQDCFFMEFQNSQCIVNLNVNLELLKRLNCRALITTSKGDGDFHEYHFISRYFAPKVGINEDPVCASAHCRLIPYWSSKLNIDKMIAFQASKRGGIIHCHDIKDRVIISGEAVTVIKGELC